MAGRFRSLSVRCCGHARRISAERDGLRQTPGNGRVYHILFTGTDLAGATCHGEAKVGVRF